MSDELDTVPSTYRDNDRVVQESLRFLDGQKLIWRLPDDPLVDDVLIPAIACAEQFDCMVGFFGAQALRQLAPGLADFIYRAQAPMRLLVSPLFSADDLEAMRQATELDAETLGRRLEEILLDPVIAEDALANHTLECLTYLIASNRLQIKIVNVADGIFHLKEWIIRHTGDAAVLSGSANFTARAMTRNIESLHLYQSWRNADHFDICTESIAEFEAYWKDEHPGAAVYSLPEAIRRCLVATYHRDSPPSHEDYIAAAATYAGHDTPAKLSMSGHGFRIPSGLSVGGGDYAHQSDAIQAWEDHDRCGILALATGAGKTISALAAAKRLHDTVDSLLVVVVVPTRPLVSQWNDECRSFGLEPLIMGSLSRSRRASEIAHVLDNLRYGVSDIETMIMTNEGFVDEETTTQLDKYVGKSVLIADEVHNLGGVQRFLTDAPSWPEYRLGLSATPIRQYDDTGSEQLLEYFGPIVFEYSLEDAIGTCLVEYDYHVHSSELAPDEFEKYCELSARIRIRLAQNDEDAWVADEYLQLLRNQRRLLLENCAGKLETLARLLDEVGTDNVARSLFYATDKAPAQLEGINALLKARRIPAHQVTQEETSQGRLVERVLDAFQSAQLRALTAKRVLDEGINVPQIDVAYILASTTIERQWTQRRGRVLRICAATGKTHATIHDFVALPPVNVELDRDALGIVNGELSRCEEFARLARNRAAPSGPFETIDSIRNSYRG